MSSSVIHHSSFRDISGFLFYDGARLLRQVNQEGKDDFVRMHTSGLYDALTAKGWLIPHREIEGHPGAAPNAHKVIEPDKVDFISYPYEWCFSQLKDAALLTLRIQKAALKHGMWLKDASAYNVQFHHGKPMFIDTLSFAGYEKGMPWPAYRQFVEHFLAPLALMSYAHPDMNRLLCLYLDGIPLDRVVALLPARARWRLSLWMHIFLHARAQNKHADNTSQARQSSLSERRLFHLIESLGQAVRGLKLKTSESQWGDYYLFTNYSGDAFEQKKTLVSDYLKRINPRKVWDLGANTGEFTRLAEAMGAHCIAFDVDPLAVEAFYLQNKQANTRNILPLIMDLTNPSPAIGWANRERAALYERDLPDTLMALALIHHLAISNNLPFEKIAACFAQLASTLVIEFVPKADSQVQKLLAHRADVYPRYDARHFEQAFSTYYDIADKQSIAGTQRTLYLMKRTKSG